MFCDELSKALRNYQIINNCTLVSMARKCGCSHHKMGYLMGAYNTKGYKHCDSVKVDSKLEDGLRMMGIHIKVVTDGGDIQEDKE